jgi:hypothetical protein
MKKSMLYSVAVLILLWMIITGIVVFWWNKTKCSFLLVWTRNYEHGACKIWTPLALVNKLQKPEDRVTSPLVDKLCVMYWGNPKWIKISECWDGPVCKTIAVMARHCEF